MCVLNSKSKVVTMWRKIEPLLDEANLKDFNDRQDYAFMQIQVLQWAFWFVPWHWAAIYEQLSRVGTNKRTFLLGNVGVDCAAVVLGAYIQSIACYFSAAYLDMTDDKWGVYWRTTMSFPQEFWLINCATIIGAGLHFVHFHVQDVEDAVKAD